MDRPNRPEDRSNVRRKKMDSPDEFYLDDVANEEAPPQASDSNEDMTTAALADASSRGSADTGASEMPDHPLLVESVAGNLRNQWDGILTGFVDEPRQAVRKADILVAATMKRLAETFTEERSKLERQWDRGDEVSTEDLRLALQRYRSFFHRLLTV